MILNKLAVFSAIFFKTLGYLWKTVVNLVL
jgi:hypothetical protein